MIVLMYIYETKWTMSILVYLLRSIGPVAGKTGKSADSK